jgi:hypothetical protein
MRKLLLVFSIPVLCSIPSFAQNAEPTSIYTNLYGKNCRSAKTVAETGSSVQKCSGAGNYSLLVLDDDNRMSLTLLSPDGKEHPLDLWTIITKSFSTLGEKAEWRVVRKNGKVTPVALIVRVNANIQENPDKPQKASYLAVTKITAEKVCVTDRVDSSAEANTKARKLADDSAHKDCLKP